MHRQVLLHMNNDKVAKFGKLNGLVTSYEDVIITRHPYIGFTVIGVARGGQEQAPSPSSQEFIVQYILYNFKIIYFSSLIPVHFVNKTTKYRIEIKKNNNKQSNKQNQTKKHIHYNQTMVASGNSAQKTTTCHQSHTKTFPDQFQVKAPNLVTSHADFLTAH